MTEYIFTEWDGYWPGENVGHVDGSGAACEVWFGDRFIGILKQSASASFSFLEGEYPNEAYHHLSARKRHTAKSEVIKILESEVRRP